MLTSAPVMPTNLATAARLAKAKGCVLRVMQTDEDLLYWIENSCFIGRPYECLNELVQFIQILPSCLSSASDCSVSIVAP
ncbi:MAG: hypothetical protein KME15_06850 [Drouetiella hepatica Uher 2000/2452]|jgi:hypothetical protein|uniref:Uncharacterized protein n=1 Tax=Drouetiella hepatica Uher 2000/2452 TaxID=904376 RepID=A0A951QAQ7_9CYAN|nr:hypothetical protein [Drouetiella hepatica Uher 2000/2452]